MAHTLDFKNNILDGLEVLGSFRLPNAVWGTFEKHAIAKMDDAILKLRGSQYYVQELTPEQAKQELNTLNAIIEELFNLQKNIEEIDDEYFQSFKRKAAEFCKVVDEFYEDLQDIAEENAPYYLSRPVLEEDWERPEDDHWDEY